MTLTTILLAAQVIAVLIALFSEKGEDKNFAGDKLGYRS